MTFLFIIVASVIVISGILTCIIWAKIFMYSMGIRYEKDEKKADSLIKYMLICAAVTIICAGIMFETDLCDYNPFIIT